MRRAVFFACSSKSNAPVRESAASVPRSARAVNARTFAHNRSMPLTNRVTPFGEIVANRARGTMFGNRGGCMHSDDRRILRQWVNRRWICCVLEYKGWHREVMQPNRYTELFFLDEATAFAAGHRPCALCRRADHQRFKEAWCAGNPEHGVAPDDSIERIDAVLHHERLIAPAERPVVAALHTLTDGAMVSRGEDAFLLRDGRLWRWSFDGYERGARPRGPWTVLTPPSVTAAFAAGYAPAVHPSVA